MRYDFSVLGNTPITFPIEWHNSKIPGFALRANVPPIHGFSAYVVMSSVAARFFPPQVGGAGSNGGAAGTVRSASTTTSDSTRPRTCSTRSRESTARGSASTGASTAGLVAGSVPCYNAVRSEQRLRSDASVLAERAARRSI